ncbi:MAG: hypothetical protein ABW043_11035 [Devosia sp.]|uniref:hypothetical protein n=1 Tax=Devosia sp. TaxID=1871048 RepID=UPI0033937B0B
MKQFALSALVLLSSAATQQVLAADYGAFPGLRPSYPDQWQQSEENPLRFEAGLRYWYAIGQQSSEIGGNTYNTTDYSHIPEIHLRVDDDFTSSFVKAQAGYAALVSGEHTAGTFAPSSFSGGHIGYAGGDFGYTPFGNENVKVGGLVGYQYLLDSPDRNRLDVQHINGLNVHMLRLGLTGRANLGDFADIEAEAVAIPYAFTSGATAEIPFANTVVQGVTVNRRSTETTGAMYGASGQVMVGFHPTENLTIRVGGRAWYLTGPASAREKQWNAATPNSYLYSDTPLNAFSLLRYGGLLEVTGRF